MTPKERQMPEIININRKKRIAKGSGNTLQNVNLLIKQHENLKKMVKKMNKTGKSKELEQMFGEDI